VAEACRPQEALVAEWRAQQNSVALLAVEEWWARAAADFRMKV
jgi:hypothetical protein